MKSLRDDPDSGFAWGEIHKIDDISTGKVIFSIVAFAATVAVLYAAYCDVAAWLA
jgi:hypothetical protein